jgi:hypothetical protein
MFKKKLLTLKLRKIQKIKIIENLSQSIILKKMVLTVKLKKIQKIKKLKYK